jgi:copper oxidase (laccase) domain-containing protein
MISESSSRLEFPLAQGWCKGLVIAFEDIQSSSNLKVSEYLHVKQVHGTKIYEPTYRDLQVGGEVDVQADGICLNSGQISDSKYGLLVRTADCVPLVYVHRTEERVCIVHAGWRGLQQGIHLKPFHELGFDPRDTWVWLGPSLNGFEVGEDMWSQFSDQDDVEVFSPLPQGPSKRLFHPWQKIEKDFKSLQVELLYNVEINTSEDHSFASWRRTQEQGLDKVPQQNYSWVRMIR